MRKQTHPEPLPALLSGKTVAISGATGGLGSALCRRLARAGAELVLIDRTLSRQERLTAELKAEFPELRVRGIIADMEDIRAVRSAAEQLRTAPLHVLILNAGAYSIPRHKTSMGYDNVFQINFVSPYLLTRMLLPHIRACGGKVIAVGSIAHRYSAADERDVDFSTRTRASLVYGNAKRYLMYAFFALAEQGEPVAVAHPGISFTGITAHYPKVIFALIKHPMRIIFMKPEKACLSIWEAIFRDPPPCHWVGPRWFGVWGRPVISRVRSASPEERLHISRVAEELAGRQLFEGSGSS